MTNKIIPKPSSAQVKRYLKLWDTRENYKLQEGSLKKLFSKTYPLNNNLDDVLIKVASLNAFYSTQILNLFNVAKHIVALKIDNSLSENDLDIVDKIAKVKMNNGKIRRNYSFATKYCSQHKPSVYPIYDSYIEKMLIYFRNKDNFAEFRNADLKDFESFKNILLNFREYYGLEHFTLKQIDQYLWLAGKEHFPRRY